jgi:hypothetical protein
LTGHRALQYEVRGDFSGIQMVQLHTKVETPNNYHPIVVAASTPEFDRDRSALEAIIPITFSPMTIEATKSSSFLILIVSPPPDSDGKKPTLVGVSHLPSGYCDLDHSIGCVRLRLSVDITHDQR